MTHILKNRFNYYILFLLLYNLDLLDQNLQKQQFLK